VAPDPEADQGEHRFTYGILPFSGTFSESGVVRSAYELNSPPAGAFAGIPKPGETSAGSFCEIDGNGVIVEGVKVPENGVPHTLVLRLYESLGGTADIVLRFSKALKSGALTDMLEENPKAAAVQDRELSLRFRPFEIKTLTVTFKD
jgi:alpha-mannosidase